MIKSYQYILLIMLIFAGTFLVCLTVATGYNDLKYTWEREQYDNGNLLNMPVKNGLLDEMNIIYYETKHLSSGHNIILIGPSTVRDGLIIRNSTIPKIWNVHNFAIGGTQLTESMVLVNYFNAYANHPMDKSDVVVIHMSYWSFYDPPESQKYVTQTIEAYGMYKVDASSHVSGTMPDAYQEWVLSKERILSPVHDITGINKFSVGQSLYLKIEDLVKTGLKTVRKSTTTDNRRTGHSAEEIAQYAAGWEKISRNVTFSSAKTESFKEFLRDLNNQTNVIIIDNYVPSWQRNLSKQKEYRNWSQSEIIPFLHENNITYIDLSETISDDEFADSGHLTPAGREHFTQEFDASVIPVLNAISPRPVRMQNGNPSADNRGYGKRTPGIAFLP